MTRALVSFGAVETRLLIRDGDGRPIDALVERAGAPPPAGAVAVGRVTAVDRGLDAVFADLGLDRPGLLPRGAGRDLGVGDSVAVRVARSPAPGKGPRLSRAGGVDAGTARPPAWLDWPDTVAALLTHAAPETIVAEGDGAAAALRRRIPALADRVAPYTGTVPLFAAEGPAGGFPSLIEATVPLDGGGRLCIEPVTGLTAVDIDTGGAGGRAGSDATAATVGIAAARELARQIRLRGLAGLIVADFPPVERRAERRRITDALAEAGAADPVGLDIEPMRASGLIEITRHRMRPPLHEVLAERAAPETGGWIPTAVTVALDALCDVERAARAHPAAVPRITAAPDVAGALDAAARPARDATAARVGRPLRVAADGRLDRTSFDVTMDPS